MDERLPDSERDPPPCRIYLTTILGTLVASALLTPLIYSATHGVFSAAGIPYSRVFARVVLVCFAAFVLVYRRHFDLESVVDLLRRGSIADRAGWVCTGAIVSIVVTSLFVPFAVPAHAAPVVGQWLDLVRKILRALATGVIVGLFEECIFRALLLRTLVKSVPFGAAAAISSAAYSVVHFLTPLNRYFYERYTPWVGFEYLGQSLEHLTLPGAWMGIFGLFLVGLLLCYTLRASASLYLCIGVHAGWVVVIKMVNALQLVPSDVVSPIGLGRRYFLLASPVCWGAIAMVGVVLGVLLRFRGRMPRQRTASAGALLL